MRWTHRMSSHQEHGTRMASSMIAREMSGTGWGMCRQSSVSSPAGQSLCLQTEPGKLETLAVDENNELPPMKEPAVYSQCCLSPLVYHL